MSSVKRTSLYQFFDYCLQNRLPVAFYRIPNTKTIKVVAQRERQLDLCSEMKDISTKKGFVVAPFSEDKYNHAFVIRADIFNTEGKLPALNFAKVFGNQPLVAAGRKKIQESSRKDYAEYVKNIQREIWKGNFKKVVAARVIKKKKPGGFNVVTYFESLCKKYPSAFISLVYTEQYGLWVGATPEILLRVDKTGFSTYSLAGTKANTPNNLGMAWGPKEQEEQKIVSEYITGSFKKLNATQMEVKGPETIVAGNLLHLRTSFTFKNSGKNKWPEVVAHLHPTPAIAGLPKEKSIAFIRGHEVADRSFYSGYLGPVNLNNEVTLFVNLRCMQVLKNKLVVYVGCGITADSKPADEWKEGKMKSQTLLNVLSANKK